MTPSARATGGGSSGSGAPGQSEAGPSETGQSEARAALWTPLSGAGATNALVGGKGRWLDRLMAEGFEVPATAVVTTHAYRAVADGADLASLVERLRATDVVGGDRFDDDARAVDDAFEAASVPSSVSAAIAAAAAHGRGSDGALLAVRSSATAEDMAGTSFAGQYRSFLEVGDDEDVERAVRLVWASLWHPAPRAYRRAHGVDESDLAMAAIVMRLVPARRAGVVFTVDPGAPGGDDVRVEDVEGFGEGLVSGSVTPTVHLFPREVLERPDARDDDPVVREAALVGLAAERAFGAPQDVEWAWDGERVLVLQARPITTGLDDAVEGDGFDVAVDVEHSHTTAGIAEMLPGVLPPLVWDVAGFVVEEAFRSLFDELGGLPGALVDEHGVIGRVRGRAAMDLSVLEGVAGDLPGGSAEAVEHQYFGSASGADLPAEPPHASGRGVRAVVHDARVLRARRRALQECELCALAAHEVVDREPALGDLDDVELMALHARVWDLTARTAAAEAAVAAAAVAAYRRLEILLLRHLEPSEAAGWAQRCTALGGGGVWSTERLEAVLAVDDGPRSGPGMQDDGEGAAGAADPGGVATDLVVDPAVAEVVEGAADWVDARARLAATAAGRRVVDRLEDRLRRAGSMAVPAGPTWQEDPQGPWSALRAAHGAAEGRVPPPSSEGPSSEGTSSQSAASQDVASGERAGALDELADELGRRSSWRRRRVLTGQVVDRRLSAIRRAADDAIALLEHRESGKAAVLSLGGVLRRVHLEVGRRLVERSALDDPADVVLLGAAELTPALGGRGPSRAVLTRRRHAQATYEAQGALPRRFRGHPTPEDRELPVGDVLVGWGAGPGVASGRARVLTSPSGAALERDEVLVAPATDASWAPLFLTAAAVVVEEGGPLSHAAIVARELGIPAVLNVEGAVARLAAEAPGQVVSVDGDRGLVVIERAQRDGGGGAGARADRT